MCLTGRPIHQDGAERITLKTSLLRLMSELYHYLEER
ncbi:Uncharacterised protein [Shigella sonnei]|nr:Uncharacterised protein [Shigella sonnei]SIY69256.1 Uncharacterised protein [Shigella sonnei]